jgi:hypothetical protein
LQLRPPSIGTKRAGAIIIHEIDNAKGEPIGCPWSGVAQLQVENPSQQLASEPAEGNLLVRGANRRKADRLPRHRIASINPAQRRPLR